MLIFLAIGLVVVLTIAYFACWILYPEWIGISGEDTKKTLEAHQEEPVNNNEGDSVDSNL